MCALVLTHTSQTNAEHGKRKVSHEAYGWGLLVRRLFRFGLDIAQAAVFRFFLNFRKAAVFPQNGILGN